MISKPTLVLDKSWVQGASTSDLAGAAMQYSLGFSEPLFYEILTSSPPEAIKCLRRLRSVESSVIVLPGVGGFLRIEIANARPVGPLEGHAISKDVVFNIKESDGELVLGARQIDLIERERVEREIVAPNLYAFLFRTLPSIFPSLADDVRGGQRDKLDGYEQTIANEPGLICGLLEASGKKYFPAASALNPEWFFYRRVQTLLLAGLEYVRAYGTLELEPMPTKLPNFILDLPYVTMGVVSGALATREKQLARWAKLLREDAAIVGI